MKSGEKAMEVNDDDDRRIGSKGGVAGSGAHRIALGVIAWLVEACPLSGLVEP
jgi:hypothetical protein